MTGTDKRGPRRELTQEEVIRLVNEAKERGEPAHPILRRYVLQTIDRVLEHLDTDKRPSA